MSTEARKHLSPEEKVAILRRHLLDKVPVSDLCDQYGIQPTNFYNWQKIFFENGAAAFCQNGRGAKKADDAKEQKIASLEAKLNRKNEVLLELIEEHTHLKKVLGEP
jgi:transposase